MCGVFGWITDTGSIPKKHFRHLALRSQRRGSDASGLIVMHPGKAHVVRAGYDIRRLLDETPISSASAVFGHTRLATNGSDSNQPVVAGGVCVIHNGIVLNDSSLWQELGLEPETDLDSEVIAALARSVVQDGGSSEAVAQLILTKCAGVVSCIVLLPGSGQGLLISNNGSLYYGFLGTDTVIASEASFLHELECSGVEQVIGFHAFELPRILEAIETTDLERSTVPRLPALIRFSAMEDLLVPPPKQLARCSKCILPATMPFITFDDRGICNYCHSYRSRLKHSSLDELRALIEGYRRSSGPECIVPFSGGRDSSYALHLVSRELGLRTVAYTYDWGMITDLGRRNISLMCSALGIENIVVAANLTRKRRNISKNLHAWLARPHLGMLSLLTAGDKHFYRHVKEVKSECDIDLELWGINPLEVTHFKSGFLGLPPHTGSSSVFRTGLASQFEYHTHRGLEMLRNPRYCNTSIWDTISGEYWRSVSPKEHYFALFDFWEWRESDVEEILDIYGWERAVDTKSSWRIGDGTAAFYNYVYTTVAGFSEHDTFRSNQIREGHLTRDEALALVAVENLPRYPNIQWYLDVLGFDFETVIRTVNEIPRLYDRRLT